MDLKDELVLQAQKRTQNYGLLCGEYGMSRKTGYKGLSRFTDYGEDGLWKHSTRPESSPHKVSEEIVCKLVNLKLGHMIWGLKEIHALYLRTIGEPVSLSSVKRIPNTCRLVIAAKATATGPVQRLNERHEALAATDIWSVDLKG